MKKKILIFGANSLIAKEFISLKEYDSIKVSHKKGSSDLIYDFNSDINKLFHSDFDYSKIQYVLFYSAINGFENCSKSRVKSYHINVTRSFEIIKFFVKKHIKVIMFSTSYVFSGVKKSKRQEHSYKRSSYDYSKQKIILKNKIKRIDPSLQYVTILRISKVITKSDHLLNDLINKGKINCFGNLYFSPISIKYLLICIKKIIDNDLSGIFHLSGEKPCSYYDFYKEISQIYHYLECLILKIKVRLITIILYMKNFLIILILQLLIYSFLI